MAPVQPTSAATATINGNGALKAKIAASGLSVMMIPVLGVFSGMVVLGEQPHWQDYAALVLILAFHTGGPAVAQSRTPVALVEEVKGRVAGVAEMDYMTTGKVVRLTPQDRLVLSYLNSCQRETITGGVVTVGTERSDVRDGNVQRETIACDAGRLVDFIVGGVRAMLLRPTLDAPFFPRETALP